MGDFLKYGRLSFIQTKKGQATFMKKAKIYMDKSMVRQFTLYSTFNLVFLN